MKRYAILGVLSVVFVVISCGPGDTVVTGNYGRKNAPDSVSVILSNSETPLMFPVDEGVFTATIPTSKIHSALVGGVYLIPDGNKMEIDFSASRPILDPKNSEINKRVVKFLEEEEQLLKDRSDFMVQYQSMIERREIVSPEFIKVYTNIETNLDSLCRHTIEENLDNDLGIQALKIIYKDMQDNQINAILDRMSQELMESDFISMLRAELERRARTAEGKMFTDFTITYEDESPAVSLSDYVGKGKYVLVDFWASWCGSCRAQFPRLRRLYDKYKGDNFELLGICVWDSVSESIKALKELKLPWPNIYGAFDIPENVYGITGAPYIILFGPDGMILNRDLRGKAIDQALEEHLGK